MLRILIADDERLEREALQFIAKQISDVHTEVVLAGNGREAVELARDLRPDLVFLDIKMPVMGGMEAAREIRESYPGVRIVFLTAFDQFELAQEAVRLHADDFIIKPADNERVVNVIRDLGKDRNRERDTGADAAELAEAKLIADTVLGNADAELLRRFLGLGEQSAVLTTGAVVRIEAGDGPNENPAGSAREAQRRVLAAVRHEAEADGLSILGSFERSAVYVLIAVPGHRAPATALLSMEQALERALVQAADEHGIVATAGIDSPDVGFSGLGLRFANAKSASRTWDEDESAGLVRRYQPANRAEIHPRREMLDSERSILQGIVGDAEELRRSAAERFLSALGQIAPTAEMQETEVARSLAYLTHATAMYVGSIPEGVDLPGAPGSLDARFAKAVETLAAHVRTRAEGTHRAVTAARRIIESRFEEDLSLDRIAEEVEVSAFHLSRIFKAATGATVLDYMTSTRMEEAKRLMRETNLSIKEVAAAVGYNDQNYFSRVFRRVTGTTPSSFRRGWQ